MKIERMIATPWQWQFPPIAEPSLKLYSQINHVRMEASEAEHAEFYNEGDERIAEELMDVIHAAETALRLLPFDELELDRIKRGVVEKNNTRGYYGGAE